MSQILGRNSKNQIFHHIRVTVVITRELIQINRQTGHDRESYEISENLTEKKIKKTEPDGQFEFFFCFFFGSKF